MSIFDQIVPNMGVITRESRKVVGVTHPAWAGVTTGEIFGKGFFLQEARPLFNPKGWKPTPKPADYLIPLADITLIEKKWGYWYVFISLTRDELRQSLNRWQVEMEYGRQGTQPRVRPLSYTGVVVDSPTPPPQKSIMGSFESALSQMAAITAMKEKVIKEFGMIPPKMQELFDKAELECINGVTLDTMSLTGLGGIDGNG